MLTGECLCGAVGFTASGEVSDVSFCHCSLCRRATGSAFGAYGAVAEGDFRWTRGEPLLASFLPTARLAKFFCTRCGSTLATRHAQEPGVVHLSLGCLVGVTGLAPAYHQFTASAADWYHIRDDLPQHPGPPGER